MSAEDGLVTCPLCGYEAKREHVLLHIEESHVEDQSSTVATTIPDVSQNQPSDTPRQGAGSDEEECFVECPISGCLELITSTELNDHIDLHAVEGKDDDDDVDSHTSTNVNVPEVAATDIAGIPNVTNMTSANGNTRGYQSPYSRREDAPQSSQKDDRENIPPAKKPEGTIEAWKKLFNLHKPSALGKRRTGAGASPARRRLGKAELGKYAYESQMPPDLVKLLKEEKYASAEGIIYALSAVLQQSSTTEYAYLCNPAVQHISKLRNEGGFCGYRNIQMLTSYIIGANAMGEERFRSHIPSIFLIQDYIENAWDMGINESGRVETGGIKGTRKFIGTPEAQALFMSLKIPCEAEGFRSEKGGVAEAKLLATLEKYFQGVPYEANGKVRCTQMPPIYFQHRGHSMTIVGLERRTSGVLELLVFDPMFRAPAAMTQLAELKQPSCLNRRNNQVHVQGQGNGRENKPMASLYKSAEAAMKLYRRGHRYLRRYTEFEILKLGANAY